MTPEEKFVQSLNYLKNGKYSKGWKLYESRFYCQAAKANYVFDKPLLQNLKEAKNKRVLFSHEQGFGDSIQFMRYAPLLSEAGANVIVLCPQPLKRLFETTGLQVVTSKDGIEYDYECPMLHAPKIFGTTLKNIPTENIYNAGFDITLPDDKPNIGLVWAGQDRDNPELKIVDQERSIPITMFSDILDLDAHFYSFQYGARANDVLLLPEELRPIQILQPHFDFLDTARLMKKMDLIITVDTAAAHIAGSVGVPVWILSRLDGCWRWLQGRTDTPWYQSATIFHQEEKRNWKPVVEEIKSTLNR